MKYFKTLTAVFFFLCFTITVHAQVIGGLAPTVSASIYDADETVVGYGGDFVLIDQNQGKGLTGSYIFSNSINEEIFGNRFNVNQHSFTLGPVFRIESRENNTAFLGLHGGLNVFDLQVSDDSEKFDQPLVGASLGVLSSKSFFGKVKTSYYFETDDVNDFFSIGISLGVAFN